MLHGPALLFCPADRPDRFAKASDSADLVIFDLEDGVLPADRELARRAILEQEIDWGRAIVRISPGGTADQLADVELVARAKCRTVMLAKAESPEQVLALSPLKVVALCETPRGVVRAGEIAVVGNVCGLMWGAEDLMAALGGSSSRTTSGAYRDVAVHARSAVLLAASAAGIPAIDAVFLDIGDLAGLAVESREAAATGFSAKACIHPSQVPVVRDAFRPTADEVAWARRLLEVARSERGVFRFEGRMVDGPLLTQAQNVLAAVEGPLD